MLEFAKGCTFQDQVTNNRPAARTVVREVISPRENSALDGVLHSLGELLMESATGFNYRFGVGGCGSRRPDEPTHGVDTKNNQRQINSVRALTSYWAV